MSKICSTEDVLKRTSDWRSAGHKIAFTCGTFDLLHAGHIDYLEHARSFADRLIVAINSNESVRSYKHPGRPIIDEQQRLKVIAALAAVDAAVLMTETRPTRLIELIKPDLYVKGGDYTTQQLHSRSLVQSYGGRCEIIPLVHTVSTTAIIKRIEHLTLHAPPRDICQTNPLPIVFADRDGTLIENVPFMKDASRVRLVHGVGEGLRALQNYGFRIVIITNQQGLGLGYFSYDEFVSVNAEILRQLSSHRVRVSRFYFCPHSFADQCNCRKPGTQLIERALADFNARANECYLIGDSPSDMEAALGSGCKGVLLSNKLTSLPSVSSFHEAVDYILQSSVVSA